MYCTFQATSVIDWRLKQSESGAHDWAMKRRART